MKMSPPRRLSTEVVEFGVSVIDGDPSCKRFIELDACPGEAETMWLGRDLEAASLPLHDVVVADAAFVEEAADALEVLGSGTPGLFRVARGTTEAPVVVGQEAAEDLVGGVEVSRAGEAEFAGEAILEGAPQALDAALGLWAVGGDVGDTELAERAAELRGLAAAGELFFHRPVLVVADEDAVAIAVEAERDAVAAQQAAAQAKVAAGVFGGEELGHGDVAGGVVEEAEQGELRAAVFEPVVQAAVEKQHLAFASAAEAALAMSRSTSLAGRAEARRTQQPAQGLAAQREAFDLAKLFAEMMVVETGVARAGQLQDARTHRLRQAAGARPPATGVCHRRLPTLPIARFETFDMPRCEIEECGGSGTRQVPLQTR